ncbi:MAG: AAA family ATPase, partial [Actinomycetota bacterium]|nr:AAA family ATPase [Actinomycetota bacterium]
MAAAALLGRDAELATLTGLLDETGAGEQRVALVCGDPGIGKTTLVEALEATARDRGVATVWGRCWEGGGGAPFWPWVQVLRACLRRYGEDLLPSLGPARVELGRVLPELGATASPAPSTDSNDARAPLFLAVADLLDAAAGAGLVIALDDLHDADEGSLQLLRFLARRSARSPLFLVGTYRVMEVARSAAHQRALGAVGRHGPTIRLRGLSPADVAVLVDRTGTRVPPAQVVDVHRVTDGNPFLVYEASRLLGAARSGPATARSLLDQAGPSLVHARLDPLAPELRSVLAAAAVLGREFTVGVLGRLCDRTPDDVLDLLAQGCHLHVIDETSLGRWAFSHALVRDELLQELGPGERARLHQRAAEALESHPVDDAGATVAAVAHHLVEGGGARALESCIRAARSALEALAFEDAAAWYERALAQPADPTTAQTSRYELLLDLGSALLLAGDVDRAIEAHDGAIRAAQASGSLELAAEAAVRIAAFTSTDPTVIGALDDALCDLPDTDSSLRARVLVCFAQVLRTSSVDRTVLENVSRQGMEMARRVGDDETMWAVLTQWHENAKNGILTVERRAEHLAVAQDLVRLAEKDGSPQRRTQARLARAYDLMGTGHAEAARTETEECLRISRELRLALTERKALLLLFEVLCFAGEISAAEEVVEQLRVRSVGVDEDRIEVHTFASLRTLRRLQGRFDELEALARETMERWTVSGLDCTSQLSRVLAVAELGRTGDAIALLDHMVGGRFVEESFGLTVTGVGWVPAPRLCCPCALLEACCLIGERHGAEALYDRLLPYAEDYSMQFGVTARYLGLAAALFGRHD